MSNDRSSVQVLPTEIYFALIREQLSENGQAFVRVTGISMWPLLHHLRDGVILTPPRPLRTGDIVLFDRRNGRYALHRVIRVEPDGFTMAGDHQWSLERHLPFEQVVGVAQSIVRSGRRISCDNIWMKMYARILTAFTFPRIYLWRAVKKACSIFHPSVKPG